MVPYKILTYPFKSAPTPHLAAAAPGVTEIGSMTVDGSTIAVTDSGQVVTFGRGARQPLAVCQTNQTCAPEAVTSSTFGQVIANRSDGVVASVRSPQPGASRRVMIWRQGAAIEPLPMPPGETCRDASPAGRFCLAGRPGAMLSLINLADGKPALRGPFLSGRYNFSARIAASDDGTVLIPMENGGFDKVTETGRADAPGDNWRVHRIAPIGVSGTVVEIATQSVCANAHLRIVDRLGTVTGDLALPFNACSLDAFIVSPDGAWLLAGTLAGRQAELYALHAGRPVLAAEINYGITLLGWGEASFSPSSHFLAILGQAEPYTALRPRGLHPVTLFRLGQQK
jgi:hypothetical protein